MPEHTVTRDEFAASIKAKYPAYASVPNAELAARMLEKYPQYRARVVDRPRGLATIGELIGDSGGLSALMARNRQRVRDVGGGVVSGLMSTAFQGGDLIRRGLGMERVIETPEAQVAMTPPASRAGQAGFFLEQLGELATPTGLGRSVATRMATRGLTRRGLPTVARAGAEALELGGKTALQTGGDPEDVMTAMLWGAAIPPVLAGAKTVGPQVTRVLPERLYSQVFSMAKDDLRQAYQAAARAGAAPNPTLASEALERGLAGSSRNMAVYSFKKLDTLEAQLQQVVSGKNIKLPNKTAYMTLLDDIASETGETFSRMGREARILAAGLRTGIRGPYVSAERALQLKRFLDHARNTSSFRLSAKLSPKQEEFKEAADLVRTSIHQQLPKGSTLLNEERVFIQAIDAIVNDAVRRNNRRLLGLTDYMLGGGGLASGYGVSGFGAAAAVRGFQRPFTLTTLGKTLHRLGEVSPSAEPFIRAGAGAAVLTPRRLPQEEIRRLGPGGQ